MGETLAEPFNSEHSLDTVLELIELTQSGDLSWLIDRRQIEQQLEELSRTVKLDNLISRTAVTPEDENEDTPHDRLLDLLTAFCGAPGYQTEYKGKTLRLYKVRQDENTSGRRAKLDIIDATGRTVASLPQSAALDDLLRTVEKRTRSSQPSGPGSNAG